jgi:hypothetical protein
MNNRTKYSGERFNMIPGNPTLWSACLFDNLLYAGMSFKGGIWNDGILVVDMINANVKSSFTELGPVYFIKELNNVLVAGGAKGLLLLRQGENALMFPVKGGINTAAVVDDQTLIVGGQAYLGFYDLGSNKLMPYPFGPEDIGYLKEIHSIVVMPECYVVGRDVTPPYSLHSAIGLLRKDIEEKADEMDELYRLHPDDEIVELIKNAEFADHKKTFPTITTLIDALMERSPSYVRDIFYWKNWLVVSEFSEAYAINCVNGRITDFSHGGFLIEQDPQRPDELWIGGPGSGVMIIRYSDKQHVWIEERQRSEEINNALADACGTESDSNRLYISCICFLPDKILISTESYGTYLLKAV